MTEYTLSSVFLPFVLIFHERKTCTCGHGWFSQFLRTLAYYHRFPGQRMCGTASRLPRRRVSKGRGAVRSQMKKLVLSFCFVSPALWSLFLASLLSPNGERGGRSSPAANGVSADMGGFPGSSSFHFLRTLAYYHCSNGQRMRRTASRLPRRRVSKGRGAVRSKMKKRVFSFCFVSPALWSLFLASLLSPNGERGGKFGPVMPPKKSANTDKEPKRAAAR